MTEILVRRTGLVAALLLHHQSGTLGLSRNTQTLESPVVSHVEVGEAGGQDVGAVLVPLQI